MCVIAEKKLQLNSASLYVVVIFIIGGILIGGGPGPLGPPWLRLWLQPYDLKISFYMLIFVPLHFWLVPPHFACSGDSTASGPAPRGAFWGRASPNENCAPLSDDCASKKVTGSVPLECSSRLETPKVLIITPEFVSKNCCFADSAVKNFLFVFMVVTHAFEEKKFLCPPKKLFMPPQLHYSGTRHSNF